MQPKITVITLKMLENGDTVTAERLASAANASRKTVLASVRSMRARGIPVEIKLGRSGGVKLSPAARLSIKAISEPNLAAAMQRLMCEPPLAETFEEALGQVQAPGQEAPAKAIQGGGFIFDATDWCGLPSEGGLAGLVSDAVDHQRVLVSNEPAGPRRLWPLKLVWKAPNWFLIAVEAGEHRVFRVDQLWNPQVEDETFEVDPAWPNPEETWAKALAKQGVALRKSKVRVRMTVEGIGAFGTDMADLRSQICQTPMLAGYMREGVLEASDPDRLVSHIAGVPGRGEVLEPPLHRARFEAAVRARQA